MGFVPPSKATAVLPFTELVYQALNRMFGNSKIPKSQQVLTLTPMTKAVKAQRRSGDN